MDYDYFTKKLDCRFDIVDGELVETNNGKFVVTTDFVEYAICLNPITKTWNIVAPKKSYLARRYILRQSDCITLNGEWLDDHYNTDYVSAYKKFNRKEFQEFFKTGLSKWYNANGFYTVDEEPKAGDTLVYAYKPNYNAHVAIYLGDSKILHHMPKKLSGIDTCDYSKIVEIFRYAGNA